MTARVFKLCGLVLYVSIGLLSTVTTGNANAAIEVASGSALNEVERKKRHLVYRFHELTIKGAARCPIENYPGYHSALSKFKSTFPDLVEIIDTSPHRAYANQMMSKEASSELHMRDVLKWRDDECKFYEELLHAHANDERGKKTIREEVIEVLKR